MYDCIRSQRRQEWELLRSKDCIDLITADACSNFFPRKCCLKDKNKHDKKEPELFKEEFRCAEFLCPCSKTYCYYLFLSTKQLNKQSFENSGDVTMAK